MTQEFIPYQQSLDMKELGFDEPCFGHYLMKKFYLKKYHKQGDGITLRPTYSQAFRFFREKYNLLGYVSQATISKGKVFMFTCNEGNDTLVEDIDSDFKTYEEAELVCLKNLIEIVKNK